jgi:hypothetical protein
MKGILDGAPEGALNLKERFIHLASGICSEAESGLVLWLEALRGSRLGEALPARARAIHQRLTIGSSARTKVRESA